MWRYVRIIFFLYVPELQYLLQLTVQYMDFGKRLIMQSFSWVWLIAYQHIWRLDQIHYNDIIMSSMASQITGV